MIDGLEERIAAPREDELGLSRRRPFPAFWEAFLLCVLFLYTQLLARYVFNTARALMNGGRGVAFPDFSFDTLALVNSVACIIVLLFARIHTGQPLRALIPWRRFRLRLLFPLAAALCGMQILFAQARNLVHFLDPAFSGSVDRFQAIAQMDGQMFLFAVVAAPLTEEMLFRGVILGGFLKRYRPVWAIGLTAFLFAFIHLSLHQGLTSIVLGLLLGWCLMRSGSIWPCIFGHSFFNALVVVVAPAFTSEYAWLVSATSFHPLWIDAMGGILMVSGIFWLRRSFAKVDARRIVGTAPVLIGEKG